ncbi:YfaP family protein [Leptothrix ochracea]|uniref:YfaP family protein n=1 Tax=Leptothrix ochracea TaxID=735331 RepID=UPI0034E2CF63
MFASFTRWGRVLGPVWMLLLGLSVQAAEPAAVEITAPVGGWRDTQATPGEFLQEVTYPAASVNANRVGANPSALIAGRITHMASMAKAPSVKSPTRRDPARLVVNGVALPLEVHADGQFARPWSFGAGSQGVSVSTATGEGRQERRQVQFFEANGARARIRLRVVLSWDSDMTDLDLHVVSPDGQHVFYGNRVAPNGGALDVDVTTGFGPEIFAHPAPPPGLWQVYVNYYGAGDARDDLTVAQIAIIDNEGTLREKQQVRRVPMRKPGELTLVHTFQVNP